MRHQLARFSTRGAKTHAVYDVVETAFQQLQQVFAGRAFQACSFLVVVAELLLQYAVDTAYFLLFTQLYAVVGQTAAARAVLPWGGFGFALTFECTHAALEEKICSLPASQLALGSNVSSHVSCSC